MAERQMYRPLRGKITVGNCLELAQAVLTVRSAIRSTMDSCSERY